MTNSISEAINALVVELTEIAIMELDADEDNTAQIEAFGTQAEAKIIAALPALSRASQPVDTGVEACSVGSCQRHGKCMYHNHPRCPITPPLDSAAEQIAENANCSPLDSEAVERVAAVIAPHLRVSVGCNPDCDDQNAAHDNAVRIARAALTAMKEDDRG